MALSEGLKGFVNFFTKSFNDGSEDDAFMDLVENDNDYITDRNLALDTMYETRVKPERSFERDSKVVSHPNNYKTGEVKSVIWYLSLLRATFRFLLKTVLFRANLLNLCGTNLYKQVIKRFLINNILICDSWIFRVLLHPSFLKVWNK